MLRGACTVISDQHPREGVKFISAATVAQLQPSKSSGHSCYSLSLHFSVGDVASEYCRLRRGLSVLFHVPREARSYVRVSETESKFNQGRLNKLQENRGIQDRGQLENQRLKFEERETRRLYERLVSTILRLGPDTLKKKQNLRRSTSLRFLAHGLFSHSVPLSPNLSKVGISSNFFF